MPIHLPRPKSTLARRATALAMVAVVAAVVVVSPLVKADTYDEQIAAEQQKKNQNAAAAGQFAAEAVTYQETVNNLQSQINGVLAQITASQAEQAALQTQIVQKQAELDSQRKLLSEDIKAMYVDGEMSPIEMLATSKNLSDFVDKEEYRNAVQKKIQDALVKITKLQSDLKIKKGQIDQLIANQQAQQAQLAAARQQQADLLAYSQAQRDAFSVEASRNQSAIEGLKAQQRAANAKNDIGVAGVGVTCGGGYPAKWCNAEQDSLIDNWGMYNRECVSYTAFKVHQDFLNGRNSRDMPYWGGVGNANQWDDNARNDGIPVDYNPTPGSIAVSNAGYYGHVMYVEQVSVINGRQAIYVSQYNASLNGRYSEVWKYTDGLVFIHF